MNKSKLILNSGNFLKGTASIDEQILANRAYIENTDYILEKGDFLKIDNITLNYTFKTPKMPLSHLSVYVSCNNVATFTAFSGEDPEQSYYIGSGMYSTPIYFATRLFSLGLNAQF